MLFGRFSSSEAEDSYHWVKNEPSPAYPQTLANELDEGVLADLGQGRVVVLADRVGGAGLGVDRHRRHVGDALDAAPGARRLGAAGGHRTVGADPVLDRDADRLRDLVGAEQVAGAVGAVAVARRGAGLGRRRSGSSSPPHATSSGTHSRAATTTRVTTDRGTARVRIACSARVGVMSVQAEEQQGHALEGRRGDRRQRADRRGEPDLGLPGDALGDERRRLVRRRRPLRQRPALPRRDGADGRRRPDADHLRDDRHGQRLQRRTRRTCSSPCGACCSGPWAGTSSSTRSSVPDIVWGWLVCGVMFWAMALPAFVFMIAQFRTMVTHRRSRTGPGSGCRPTASSAPPACCSAGGASPRSRRRRA